MNKLYLRTLRGSDHVDTILADENYYCSIGRASSRSSGSTPPRWVRLALTPSGSRVRTSCTTRAARRTTPISSTRTSCISVLRRTGNSVRWGTAFSEPGRDRDAGGLGGQYDPVQRWSSGRGQELRRHGNTFFPTSGRLDVRLYADGNSTSAEHRVGDEVGQRRHPRSMSRPVVPSPSTTTSASTSPSPPFRARRRWSTQATPLVSPSGRSPAVSTAGWPWPARDSTSALVSWPTARLTSPCTPAQLLACSTTTPPRRPRSRVFRPRRPMAAPRATSRQSRSTSSGD